MPGEKSDTRYRRIIFFAALGYTFFVIYGSLVPLDFRVIPLSEAIIKFQNIRYLSIGAFSRADWVANIILFVPLSFLWMSAAMPRVKIRTAKIAIRAIVIFPCCVALSAIIEFSQFYFPPRTVSINDLFAETIGAFVGILIWICWGRAFLRWISDWEMVQTPFSLAQRLLGIYLGGFLFYSLMPFDLTISITEIYHKWKAGRILIAPLSFLGKEPVQMLYECTTEIGLWIPPALLWMFCSIQRAGNIWLKLIGIAVFIEFSQIFVFSRVTDIGDIILASVGSGIGVYCGSILRRKFGIETAGISNLNLPRISIWAFGIVLIWIFVLVIMFWYPFDFYFEKHFIHDRLFHFAKAPLTTYYYSTEYRAITEVFHKVLFFLPLGISLSVALLHGRGKLPNFILNFLGISIIVITALSLELGQVLLPNKFADISDCFFMLLGGITGFIGTQKIHQKISKAPD